MDSNITKFEETLSFISLTLKESWKSFQIQLGETNKSTKQVDQLQEELLRMKVKYEEIKQSKIDQIAKHKDEVCKCLMKPGKKKTKERNRNNMNK